MGYAAPCTTPCAHIMCAIRHRARAEHLDRHAPLSALRCMQKSMHEAVGHRGHAGHLTASLLERSSLLLAMLALAA